jgi:hypothetical protein
MPRKHRGVCKSLRNDPYCDLLLKYKLIIKFHLLNYEKNPWLRYRNQLNWLGSN